MQGNICFLLSFTSRIIDFHFHLTESPQSNCFLLDSMLHSHSAESWAALKGFRLQLVTGWRCAYSTAACFLACCRPTCANISAIMQQHWTSKHLVKKDWRLYKRANFSGVQWSKKLGWHASCQLRQFCSRLVCQKASLLEQFRKQQWVWVQLPKRHHMMLKAAVNTCFFERSN